MGERRWEGSTHGKGWMHRSLIAMLRVIDVRVLYLFTDIFIIPWCMLRPSRRTAFRFYRGAMGYGWWKAAWSVFRNHCLFAQVVIDRFAMYAGKRFDVEIVGHDDFKTMAGREEGFVQLSSHIGNYEIAGYSIVSDRKAICPVVFAGEKASVMEGRSELFNQTNIHMITLKQDMSHLFEIDQALCRGDIVSFPADRFMEGSKVVRVPFFGKEASFPQGPFSVATMRGVDVLAVNVMKGGAKKYKIYLTPLPYDRTLPRKEQIRQLAGAYVAELETRVRQYPLQWYNFFDFWAS